MKVSVGAIVVAFCVLSVCADERDTVSDGTSIKEERYEDGVLWQTFGGSRAVQKGSFGLADELWIYSDTGAAVFHEVFVRGKRVLAEFDRNNDGKIDTVTVYLLDGRACKVTGLNGESGLPKVDIK